MRQLVFVLQECEGGWLWQSYWRESTSDNKIAMSDSEQLSIYPNFDEAVKELAAHVERYKGADVS